MCRFFRVHVHIVMLQVFEGIPPPYDKQKKMVVPNALRVLRLKPGRKVGSESRLQSSSLVVVMTLFHNFSLTYLCLIVLRVNIPVVTR